jgi:hypothetical protein
MTGTSPMIYVEKSFAVTDTGVKSVIGLIMNGIHRTPDIWKYII